MTSTNRIGLGAFRKAANVACLALVIALAGAAGAHSAEAPLPLDRPGFSPRLPQLQLQLTPAGEQHAHYRGYCADWFRICRRRWGLGTWRFRRCLAIRGCY